MDGQNLAPQTGNNFNLLRFVFASMVILSHCPELQHGNRSREFLSNVFGTISFGQLAVSSFFLLSGYLIVKSWDHNPRIVSYLRNRVLRIYPAFIVTTLVCAFVVGPMASEPHYFRHFYWDDFLTNMTLLQSPAIPSVFQETFYPLVNGAMWSIEYEFKCYLLVALFGLAIGFQNRVYWLVCFLAFTTMFLIDPYVGHGTFHDPIVRLGMMFTAGGCYFLYGRPFLDKQRWMVVALMLWALLMFNRTLAQPAVAIFWGYAILSFANRPARLFAWFNKLPDISYGVYLYAWPITKLLIEWQPEVGRLSLIVQTWLWSILAGTLSWYLIEKRFITMKAHAAPRPLVNQPA